MHTKSRRGYFAAFLLALAPVAATAQYLGFPTANVPKGADGKPNMNGPAPKMPDGKPDLQGMYGWVTAANCGAKCNDTQIPREFMNIASNFTGKLPYKPGVADLVKTRTSVQGSDPNVHCMPRGAPRIWTDDYYKRIYQTPTALIILTERNMQYRQIFLDGRPLPEDPNPTWNGYSTGHWEGDTLVVETSGLHDGLWLDAFGNPMGEKAHVTERIRRPDFGHMEVSITINDPQYYTEPWTVKIAQPLVLDSELIDYYCLENEKDFVHMKPLPTP